MGTALVIVVVLLVLFLVALKLVAQVYRAGYRIYSILLEVISIVLLTIILVYCKNKVVLMLAMVIFAFCCMVFLIAFSRNFQATMKGEGKGIIAKWIRKTTTKNKKH
ncbi:hypothetical protein OZY43_02295 [Lactobacillus sp. ESL0785]|uniref:hypothetical protein n=1 Tax=Lactobacillus sp. ESL0785 TaxID=2983232 RepID=UPI0023F8FE8A|nr:hypothetical protein [Lactobacillus sp. ESL0785]WEV71255.1 hypothetical protein OZY43_02295 [Lactobacillus sp. ESL0785]